MRIPRNWALLLRIVVVLAALAQYGNALPGAGTTVCLKSIMILYTHVYFTYSDSNELRCVESNIRLNDGQRFDALTCDPAKGWTDPANNDQVVIPGSTTSLPDETTCEYKACENDLVVGFDSNTMTRTGSKIECTTTGHRLDTARGPGAVLTCDKNGFWKHDGFSTAAKCPSPPKCNCVHGAHADPPTPFRYCDAKYTLCCALVESQQIGVGLGLVRIAAADVVALQYRAGFELDVSDKRALFDEETCVKGDYWRKYEWTKERRTNPATQAHNLNPFIVILVVLLASKFHWEEFDRLVAAKKKLQEATLEELECFRAHFVTERRRLRKNRPDVSRWAVMNKGVSWHPKTIERFEKRHGEDEACSPKMRRLMMPILKEWIRSAGGDPNPPAVEPRPAGPLDRPQILLEEEMDQAPNGLHPVEADEEEFLDDTVLAQAGMDNFNADSTIVWDDADLHNSTPRHQPENQENAENNELVLDQTQEDGGALEEALERLRQAEAVVAELTKRRDKQQ